MAAFTRVILFLNVLLFLGFGLAFTAWPARMAQTPGIPLPSPSALSDVRAIYGGMELGFAAYLAVCVYRRETVKGLLAATLVLGGTAVGRGIGLAVDGFSPITLRLLFAEGFGAVANGVVLWLAHAKAPRS
ncbi:MAG TPA: DUF4345 family protein [Myxococcaceae bacterium]|nr:DUF4345 family protein [Myxococcaceae bacterium]